MLFRGFSVALGSVVAPRTSGSGMSGDAGLEIRSPREISMTVANGLSGVIRSAFMWTGQRGNVPLVTNRRVEAHGKPRQLSVLPR